MKLTALILCAAFAICVLISICNQVYGAQAFGALAVAHGGYTMYQKEISYGIRGWKPIGYITGVPAIATGAALSIFGLFMIAFPEQSLSVIGRR